MMRDHSEDGPQPTAPEGQRDGQTEDLLAEFEQMVAALATPAYVFRLYISGASSRSVAAIANVRKICDKYLPGHYELEVIDVYQQPDETRSAQIIVVPTLIKETPSPIQRFVGDMSDTEKIVVALRLKG